MNARLLSSIFLAAMFAALAGCASTGVKSDFAFKDDRSEGLVFFSASHDLDGTNQTKAIFYIDGGPVNGGTMVYSLPENLAFWSPPAREFEDSYGQLIALTLPVGKHQITGWQVTGVQNVRVGPKGAPRPLEFSVEAGQVKYLGDLHANLRMGPGVLGLPAIAAVQPEVRDRRDRDVELFKKKYPQFKDKVIVEPLALGLWRSD